MPQPVLLAVKFQTPRPAFIENVIPRLEGASSDNQLLEISSTGTLADTIAEGISQCGESDRYVLVIDPHCEFEQMVDFINALRQLKDDVRISGRNGCILFLSDRFDSATPELDADPSARDIVDGLRHSQFYLRMLESYGWSTFCSVSRLEPILSRFGRMHEEYFQLNSKSLTRWSEDVTRVEKIIQSKLQMGPWVSTCPPHDWTPDKSKMDYYYPGLGTNLLKAMALTHQFGRVNTTKAESLIAASNIEWMVNEVSQSKKPHSPGFSPPCLRDRLQQLTLKTRELWETKVSNAKAAQKKALEHQLVTHAGARNKIRANLYVFDLLRDASQFLSKATSRWADDSKKEDSAIRILAVKDHVRGGREQAYLHEQFTLAFTAAFRAGTVALHCVAIDKDLDGHEFNQKWDTHEWWLQLIQSGEKVRVTNHLQPNEKLEPQDLLSYDIILVEAEFQNRFVGPSIIQWLDHMLDETLVQPGKQIGRRQIRPQVFVLSRDENAGHSYMCLWLGAQAFASKSRVFGIPSLLTMANVGRCAVRPDQKRLRPNFYAIDGLLPHQRNRLQSLRAQDQVYGDEWDRKWISQLPKADLHYHIGTSISLDAIRALAVNTMGYLLSGPDSTIVEELIRKACKIVLLYSLERQESSITRSIDPYRLLWAVARYIILPKDDRGNIVTADAPALGALDRVVEWLCQKDRPLKQHDACAALVTAIAVFECRNNGQFLTEPFLSKTQSQWVGLQMAGKCIQDCQPNSLPAEISGYLSYLVDRIAANWGNVFSEAELKEASGIESTSLVEKGGLILQHFGVRAIKRTKTVFDKFSTVFSQLTGQASNDPNSLTARPEAWLLGAFKSFKEQKAPPLFGNDEGLATKFTEHPTRTLREITAESGITLEQLVVLPNVAASSMPNQKSLERYLTGCDLLGAEHLQYPENIILAAMDIARQNVSDNVVYSEVRCATTGYCRGGMNVIDATDLLCVSFDLGAMLFGSLTNAKRKRLAREMTEQHITSSDVAMRLWVEPPSRWVRTNVLLGAKRHKEGDVEMVVPLVVHYLTRGRDPEKYRDRALETIGSEIQDEPGRWWRRCVVAGFDLSGNESSRATNLVSSVRPLFASCAPITIHAGEAMSADSIWEAVYLLGAQRIGHGLRLRDSSNLMEHCVRNDICLELCPISNAFTNSFSPPENLRTGYTDRSSKRDGYPLLDFMNAGLDVCLNTDNRSIHRDPTLSGEYLQAAQLCRGLSRWEVFRLCKAGFKNAFLPKDEVAAVLRHVEYEVYKIACEHSGENRFPAVGRIVTPIS